MPRAWLPKGLPMNNLWHLPQSLTVGGVPYPIRGDFRQVLQVIEVLGDLSLPEFLRWQVALNLFYRGDIPREHRMEAAGQLAQFLTCGQESTPGPQLISWQQDALLIISDVNRVAGKELRQESFVHWWTFLGWFHAIGPGQLSDVVAIRDKLSRGRRLEPQEQEFYRKNRDRVDLKRRCTPEALEEKQRLMAMLEGR